MVKVIKVKTLGEAVDAIAEASVDRTQPRVTVDVRALDGLHLDVLGLWVVNRNLSTKNLFMWSEDGETAEIDVNPVKPTHQNQTR